jgi:predicted GIY-YIG superfamily endonuclease
MTKFFYVYILQSEADPERFYAGLTDDLRTRQISQLSPHRSHFKMEAVAIEKFYRAFESQPCGSA